MVKVGRLLIFIQFLNSNNEPVQTERQQSVIPQAFKID